MAGDLTTVDAGPDSQGLGEGGAEGAPLVDAQVTTDEGLLEETLGKEVTHSDTDGVAQNKKPDVITPEMVYEKYMHDPASLGVEHLHVLYHCFWSNKEQRQEIMNSRDGLKDLEIMYGDGQTLCDGNFFLSDFIQGESIFYFIHRDISLPHVVNGSFRLSGVIVSSNAHLPVKVGAMHLTDCIVETGVVLPSVTGNRSPIVGGKNSLGNIGLYIDSCVLAEGVILGPSIEGELKVTGKSLSLQEKKNSDEKCDPTMLLRTASEMTKFPLSCMLGTTVTGRVTLKGVKIIPSGLDQPCEAKVGALHLENTLSGGDTQFPPVTGDVQITDSLVGDGVRLGPTAGSVRLSNIPEVPTSFMAGTTVEGNVDISASTLPFEMTFGPIKGNVSLTNVQVGSGVKRSDEQKVKSLDIQGGWIGDKVVLPPSKGDVSISNLVIGEYSKLRDTEGNIMLHNVSQMPPNFMKQNNAPAGVKIETSELPDDIQFPGIIEGPLALENAHLGPNSHLPTEVKSMRLKNVTLGDGVKLPETTGDVHLSNMTLTSGVVLPQEIGGELVLENVTIEEGVVLPKQVNGAVSLHKVTTIGGTLPLPL